MPTFDDAAAADTVVWTGGFGLWDIDDDAFAGAGLEDAIRLAWTGWRVVHIGDYLRPAGGTFGAVVLTRDDGIEGWAGFTMRLSPAPLGLDAARAAWPRRDPVERRLDLGRFLDKAQMLAESDLLGFGEYLSGRSTGNLGAEAEDNALFHRPWLCDTLWWLPDPAARVASDPETPGLEMDAVRMLWGLRGVDLLGVQGPLTDYAAQ